MALLGQHLDARRKSLLVLPSWKPRALTTFCILCPYYLLHFFFKEKNPLKEDSSRGAPQSPL